ncbi:MAG: arabinan endo-1,5-alpha-L-arabinosidase [Gemmatimonadetes bacterium]|nr:arabinan endo-1,5-alpha-L-arabinosidase [Gemmatimonadota bacterium]
MHSHEGIRRDTRAGLVRLLVVTAALAASAASALAQQNPPAGQQQQARPPRPPQEPTTEPGIHDPVMARQGDTYYAFGTGNGIVAWSSKDMKLWNPEPPVFATPPAWGAAVAPGFRGSLWAPDISFHNGSWYMYYSLSAFGRNTSGIGVATSPTLDRKDPRYAWTDRGMVVQSVPGRDLWNAIDPQLFVDAAGKPWLVFGSFWGGIKLARLADNMTQLAQPQEWYTIAARERDPNLDERDAGDAANPELNYDTAFQRNVITSTTRNMLYSSIEGSFMVRHGDYYYLFAAWDRCCRGVQSTSKVAVGRSKEITGPYFDRENQRMDHGGGSMVILDLLDSPRWAAAGHESAYNFDGKDYLAVHAYDKTDNGRSKLVIREIEWDAAGWPVVWLKQ